MPNDTCSVPDCGKPVKRRTFCYGHYMKAWRYGTPTPTFEPKHDNLTGHRFGSLVVVEREGSKWVCQCDCGATTRTRSGDLNRGTARSCGDTTEHRRRDDIGYAAAHERVRADRGPIKSQSCIDCGSPAQHWSYDHADPEEMLATGLSAHPVAYSNKPEHYDPRCVSCHKRFDLGRLDSASVQA